MYPWYLYSVSLYRITEFNDEIPVVLITLTYYLRSIYLYLGNTPFLTLTVHHSTMHIMMYYVPHSQHYVQCTSWCTMYTMMHYAHNVHHSTMVSNYAVAISSQKKFALLSNWMEEIMQTILWDKYISIPIE